jgi:plastocyanin
LILARYTIDKHKISEANKQEFMVMNNRGATIALWVLVALMAGTLIFGVTSIALAHSGQPFPWANAGGPCINGNNRCAGNGMMGGRGMMGSFSTPQGTPVTTNNVTIKDSFSPAIIQVHVGTSVTWTNNDDETHTVTFLHMLGGSGSLAPSGTFSYTFTTAGIYDYFCAYHHNMVGRVIVNS